MTRVLFTLCGAALLSGVGCMHFQPTGPFAKAMKTDDSAPRSETGATVTPPKDIPGGPIVQAATPFAPPAMMVVPSEVKDENCEDAIHRLMQEMEADRKAMESMPRPSEVSVIKGRG